MLELTEEDFKEANTHTHTQILHVHTQNRVKETMLRMNFKM
jgi:hypothetical protein